LHSESFLTLSDELCVVISFWLFRRISGSELARVGYETNGIPAKNVVPPCQILVAFPWSIRSYLDISIKIFVFGHLVKLAIGRILLGAAPKLFGRDCIQAWRRCGIPAQLLEESGCHLKEVQKWMGLQWGSGCQRPQRSVLIQGPQGRCHYQSGLPNRSSGD